MQTLWQTEDWQKTQKKAGQTDDFFLIENIFFEKRRLWLWMHGFFAIWVDKNQIKNLNTKKIISKAKSENALFIQIETLDYEHQNFEKYFWKLWKKTAYKKFIPRYSVTLDLTKNKEQILAEMKPKWRYNIRLAEKKWIEVFAVEKNEKNILDFSTLIKATAQRQNFDVNTEKYFLKILESLPESQLYFARHESDLLAAAIFIRQGENAYYYYGASSDFKKNLMAPYALQWHMILDAKSLWCKVYDFLGVADPKNHHDPLSGVTSFKKKFFPQESLVSENFFYIVSPMKYHFFHTIKKIKSFF